MYPQNKVSLEVSYESVINLQVSTTQKGLKTTALVVCCVQFPFNQSSRPKMLMPLLIMLLPCTYIKQLSSSKLGMEKN